MAAWPSLGMRLELVGLAGATSFVPAEEHGLHTVHAWYLRGARTSGSLRILSERIFSAKTGTGWLPTVRTWTIRKSSGKLELHGLRAKHVPGKARRPYIMYSLQTGPHSQNEQHGLQPVPSRTVCRQSNVRLPCVPSRILFARA